MSAEEIFNQIKAIWGKEGFVPSDEDVKVTKKLRAELAATGQPNTTTRSTLCLSKA